MGLPRGPAVCHAMALRLMKHFIQTGHGISDIYILWSLLQNLGGLGQGNGVVPPSWHSHMLPLIKAYESLSDEKISFSNPDRTKTFKKWLVGYVDDNTIFASISDPEFTPHATEHLISKAKECLEIWQQLIHITGGELEISKSCLLMMTWKQDKGKEVLETIEESPGDLDISSVKFPGLTVQLDRNETSTGEQILGV